MPAPARAAIAKAPAAKAPKTAAPLIARSNPLLNPNATLSGNALLQAAQGLATGATAPVISQLTSQIAQNDRQTKGAVGQVGGFYNQLGAQAKQGYADEGQIAGDLNSQLKGIGSDEQSQLQGIGQSSLASLLKYAPQSDAQGTLAAPALQALTAEIARERGLAAQEQGGFRSFGATQGANYRGLAASNLGTFALGGQEALRNIAQAGQVRNEPLEAKIASERGLYGSDLTTALGKLRQQEITNGIARQGLGIREQSAQAALSNANAHNVSANASARNAATNAGNAAFNTNAAKVGSPAWERVQNVNAKNWANNPNAVGSLAWSRTQRGSGGGRWLAQQENNKGNVALGSIMSAIQTWQQGGMKNSKGQVQVAHPTNAQMRRVLGGKYDPNLIQAAFELLSWGSLQPRTAQSLAGERYNINAGWTFRGQPIRIGRNQQTTLSPGQAINTILGIL